MDIYIDEYGNANVIEVWDAYLDSGTEGYRSYILHNGMKISDFSVVDDKGREYTNLLDWNVSGSFQDKAYSSGIVYTYDGVELCWGISQYGNRVYILRYKINNFVNQYQDNQGIYFNLFNLDMEVANISVEIYSDTLFSIENSKIWGFGNNGKTVFSNGKIVMNSGLELELDEYMVLLVRFESDIFDIKNISNKSFDDVYEEAIRDIDLIDKLKDKFNNISFFQLLLLLILLFFVIILFVNMKPSNKKKTIYIPKYNYGNLYFGEKGKILPDDKKIYFYKDIPCDKDLCYAYWVCYQYEINLITSSLKEGFIGAILLKWIHDGYVKVINLEKKAFIFSDNNYALELCDNVKLSNPVESELYEILKNASSDGKILKENEFACWCEENYHCITNWFDNIIVHTSIELKKKALIKNRIRKINSKYSLKKKVVDKVVSSKVKCEAIKLKGLRKYLLNFTAMNEKEYFDVHLWQEYLMFAQLLGIADKVSEQFNKLYPSFVDIDTVRVVSWFARKCYINYERNLSNFNELNQSLSSRCYSGCNYNGSNRLSGSGGRSYNSGGRTSGGSSGGGFR